MKASAGTGFLIDSDTPKGHLTKSCTKGTPDKKLHKGHLTKSCTKGTKGCNDIEGYVEIQTHTFKKGPVTIWIQLE